MTLTVWYLIHNIKKKKRNCPIENTVQRHLSAHRRQKVHIYVKDKLAYGLLKHCVGRHWRKDRPLRQRPKLTPSLFVPPLPPPPHLPKASPLSPGQKKVGHAWLFSFSVWLTVSSCLSIPRARLLNLATSHPLCCNHPDLSHRHHGWSHLGFLLIKFCLCSLTNRPGLSIFQPDYLSIYLLSFLRQGLKFTFEHDLDL